MPKTTHRSPGEGSITQRADGRWQGSLQVDGKRRTVYGGTRQEAARKLVEVQRQASKTGSLPSPGKRTLGDLLDAWLAVKSPSVKRRTMADYQDICERYLLPTLGPTPLSRVTPDRIQLLYAQWQADGKHRTALKVHQVLAPALALAVRWGWLAANPCDRVDRPRYQAPRKTIWTPAQLHAFLEGTRDHWLYPFWVLAVTTGARLGELLALTWNDVDLADGSIMISKATQRIHGDQVTITPKTQSGIRAISLPADVGQVLKMWRVEQAEQRLRMSADWAAANLVFSGARGQPLSANTVQDCLPRECDRLDLPRVTPHSLRHLHASLLLAEGLPITAVSKRLGHANAAVTMAIYAHALDNGDAQATEAIGRALAK